MKEGKALVLLSGGIDSTVCMAIAKRDCQTISGISFTYGQKHIKEIEHASQVAEYFGAPHFIVNLPEIFGGVGSTLIDDGLDQPAQTYQELMAGQGPSPTVVPFRNANLLSMATTFAITHERDLLYWGPHATDAHHNAYPDCTPEFAGAMACAIQIGSYNAVRLVTPIQQITKIEVVTLGLRLGAPLHLTWSCYAGDEKQCGTCPTCIERIESFKQNNMVDPVEYEVKPGWPPGSLHYGSPFAHAGKSYV